MHPPTVKSLSLLFTPLFSFPLQHRHPPRMANEKFFENGGRPIDLVDQAQFINAKSKLEDERDVVSPLPSPVSASKPKPKLSAAMIIPVWIVLSSSVIIYNNYLYNTLNFKFPVFLVTFHLGFAVRLHQPTLIFVRSKPSLTIGSRHTRTRTDDAPPRWREGCTPHKGYVYALHSPDRTPLQR